MEIFYISPLISKNKLDLIYKKINKSPGFAVQKFNRLIAKGFVHNGAAVKNLSVLPLPYSLSHAIWCNYRSEIEEDISYHYFPFFNIPIIKHLCVFFYAFIYVLFWGLCHRKEKAIVCDVLTISACLGAVLASKVNRLRTVGIMTDMPGLMVDLDKKTLFLKLASAVNRWYLSKFDNYVFLTEQMNVVNRNKRPYIVMEGLVDIDAIRLVTKEDKASPRVIMYAGMLHPRYGVQMLVDAVKMLPLQDIQLALYGNGPMVDGLKEEKDPRISYRGSVPNEVIVEEERRATLLVNPRPTHEEFTKYSFPSKNMEYMVSGTPLLTTRLPGMPKEYYPNVYLFDEETVEGYAHALQETLSLPASVLYQKGAKAYDFVMRQKSNTLQTYRILQLVNQNNS